MANLIRLPRSSASQRLWTQACEAVVGKARGAGVDLDRVTFIALDERLAVDQIDNVAPWGAAVAARGMDALAVQNRVTRTRSDGSFVENFFVCLFREPPPEQAGALSVFGASPEARAVARELFVAHEAMHCWQEGRGFDFVLAGLSAGGGPVAREASRAVNSFLSDPSLDPRPAGGESQEAAMIFEEFCSDALACKLMERDRWPASMLLAGMARLRDSRQSFESGRYQHSSTLSTLAAIDVDGMSWTEFSNALAVFCRERSEVFLTASKRGLSAPRQALDLNGWRAGADMSAARSGEPLKP